MIWIRKSHYRGGKSVKFILIVVCAMTFGSYSYGAGVPSADAKKLESLASRQIGEDFRIVFHEKKDARICGGEGDAYIGQVQVREYSHDPHKKMGVSSLWLDIDKHYSIFKRELDEPNPRLFDFEHQCME